MIEHIEKFKLIANTQHGFVRNKSCLTNLLVFMEEVTNYIDSGYPVDVIYLDFQKGFDKVPHKRLAMKLAAHGIDGELLRGIVHMQIMICKEYIWKVSLKKRIWK